MRRILALCALVSLLSGLVTASAVSAAQSLLAPEADIPAQVVAVTATGVYSGIDRIVVIVMENHSYSQIVNNTSAPYLNSLIHRYGLATNYTGVAHPSEPNYLALFSGSTQGVTDDAVHDFSGGNLADQLEAHGRTWRVVAENVPGGCYRGATFYGGPDGGGWYARKHEPAVMFKGIAGNAVRCAKITDLRHFSLTAANFQLVVPNMCHDMHDCSVGVGDAFLKGLVSPIIANPAFAHTLVVITFDEGTDAVGGGGRVVTVLIGPTVRRAARSSVAHTHYSLLRTIENAWSLGCLNRSCAANDLREFFGP